MSSVRLSIIVPLECHRGQEAACLDAWMRRQSVDPAVFEVLVAGCPDSVSPRRRSRIAAHLRLQDRVIWHGTAHDLALCHAGAEAAVGEWLFFTESHVLPPPSLAAGLLDRIAAHPKEKAFSCRSRRMTGGRLSEAEADMYEADILTAMESHPWRRVLDQCFAIRRDVYFAVGGFKARYGHFAEHLLAAELACKGVRVGYAPELEVRHFYVGDLTELGEFVRDFAVGEMIWHAEASGDDPARTFLDPPAAWEQRAGLDPACLHAARRLGGMDSASRACWDERMARLRLCWALWLRKSSERREAFVRWNNAAAEDGRQRFLVGAPAVCTGVAGAVDSWSAATGAVVPGNGFHAAERWEGCDFRWTEPSFQMAFQLPAGASDLEIEWLPIRPTATIRVSVGGGSPIVMHPTGRGCAVARIQSAVAGPTWIAFRTQRWPASADLRRLGLPLCTVRIRPVVFVPHSNSA